MNKTKYMRQSWIVFLTASTFFFYEFIQMNMFNAINTNIMQAFHLNAAQLGYLSSLYFWCSVLFLIPAGTILDRCSVKKLMLSAMLICVFCTFLFARTHTFWVAAVCRFLCGFGSAFCFLGNIRLISRWFPASKQAFMVGLLVTIAMSGGVVAQTPLILLVHDYGWRITLMLDSGFGVMLSVLILIWVRDYPDHKQQEVEAQTIALREMGYWPSLRHALARGQNWLAGIYTCLLNLPIGLFGSIWGTLYLMASEHITRADSSIATSALFMGTIIGSPLMGGLSDALGSRKRLMIVGAILSLICVGLILLHPGMTFAMAVMLYFLLGLVTSTQVLGYALVSESNPAHLTSTSVAVVSMTTIAGYAIFQPIFGTLLDWTTQGVHANYHYVLHDFRYAVLIFPVGFVVSLLVSLFLREQSPDIAS